MKHPLWFIGCDPGSKGAVAAISSQEEIRYFRFTGSTDDRDSLSVWLQQFHPLYCRCICEWNSSSPQMGVTSAFTFGMNCERIPMALVALGFSVDMVKPRVWQKALGVPPRYKDQNRKHVETQNQFKRRLWGMAVELYPKSEIWELGIGKQLSIADAVLIAEYCKRMYA